MKAARPRELSYTYRRYLALSLISLLPSCGGIAEPLALQLPVAASMPPPFASVCHLATERKKLRFKRGYFNGSAVVYKERYLITAAHNVFSPAYDPLIRLRVTCGRATIGDNDGAEVDLRSIRVARGYSWTPKRYDRDFAVIKLSDPVFVTATFRLDPGPGPFERTTIAGFPGQRNGARGMNGRTMFVGSSRGERVADKPFTHYEIDTYTGNSGGPVWVDTPSGPSLVGIHISGGRARSIDAEAIAEIERMIEDLD